MALSCSVASGFVRPGSHSSASWNLFAHECIGIQSSWSTEYRNGWGGSRWRSGHGVLAALLLRVTGHVSYYIVVMSAQSCGVCLLSDCAVDTADPVSPSDAGARKGGAKRPEPLNPNLPFYDSQTPSLDLVTLSSKPQPFFENPLKSTLNAKPHHPNPATFLSEPFKSSASKGGMKDPKPLNPSLRRPI